MVRPYLTPFKLTREYLSQQKQLDDSYKFSSTAFWAYYVKMMFKLFLYKDLTHFLFVPAIAPITQLWLCIIMLEV